jgi:protein-L-isoaspartate(D-aspartate) O-methyltransferase
MFMDVGDWHQATVEFASRAAAEQVAAGPLRAALLHADDAGLIDGWFFVRKNPCWRLRYRPATEDAHYQIGKILDELAADGQIVGWTAGIYESEAVAFGGPAAMHVAHDLFSQDSRHVLDYLSQPAALADVGRRELAILLCGVLFRAAGQDWYEQGDIWARVAEHRPQAPARRRAAQRSGLTSAMTRLMTVDAGPGGRLVAGGALSALSDWSAAFERAGQRLAALAQAGSLERGLRAVLAHHVIFFWNRLGLTYPEQAALSTLAKDIVMNDAGGAIPTTDATGPASGPLRGALADQLREHGTVRSARVEEALRTVPRHVFLPGVPVADAYADEPVYTKHDGAGVSISAASQPTVVAMMLEQLLVEPGQRVLEIGAGTGYNAGLLAHLAGPGGHVTTIDVDEDLVDGARKALANAGHPDVRVLLADGALGDPSGAPYDRLIATVGAWDLPSAWLEQIAPTGRIVVPLRLRGSISRSIAFERDGGLWRSRSIEMCTFMPLRGIGDDARRIIPLTDSGDVTLQTFREHNWDAAAFTGILEAPATEAWTGVQLAGPESFEWLDLWLTCAVDSGLLRMQAARRAIDQGLVRPQFGWGAMAAADAGSIAYLTLRPAPRAADGTSRNEVGVIGHGPAGAVITGRMVEQIRVWNREHRGANVQITVPASGRRAAPASHVVLDRPHSPIGITWLQG